MRQMLWAGVGGVAALMVAGGLFVWRPWRLPYGNQVVCAAYRANPEPGQPVCIMWGQAKSRYAAFVREPTWLPSNVRWQQLTVNRPLQHGVRTPPSLTIWYQLPQGTLEVQETPSVVAVTARHARSGRLNGQPDHVAAWTVHEPGKHVVHLKLLWFDSQKHWYMVTGFNASWADVKGVAASLIDP